MTCPHCGSAAHKVIAPGFHECLGWRPEVFTDPATGLAVARRIPCGQRYHAGGDRGRNTTCACGTFAVGVCTSCGTFVCGDHSAGGAQRMCFACVEAARAASEQQEQQEVAAENARAEAELARVRAIADPVERLLCGARFFTPVSKPDPGHNPWGRASSADGTSELLRLSLQENLVGLCPELWPDGHDGDPPWHTPKLGSWFAKRASAAGITPPPDLVPLVRRSFLAPRDELVRGRPQAAWRLPEGSTTLLSHVADEDAARYATETWADAYVLPKGEVVLHPYLQHGTKLRPAFLSPHGLAAMADVLGLTW
ncbi:hypothetical protein [Lentzea sp. NPDC055074]